MPLRSLQPDYGGRQSMESPMDAQSSRGNTNKATRTSGVGMRQEGFLGGIVFQIRFEKDSKS